MLCPACGQPVRDRAAFCGGCGTALAATPAAPLAEPAAAVSLPEMTPSSVAVPPAPPSATPDTAVIRVLRFGLATMVGVTGLAQLAVAWLEPWSDWVLGPLGFGWLVDGLSGFGQLGQWGLAATLVVVAALLVWRPRAGALASTVLFGVGTLGLATYAVWHVPSELALLVAQGPPIPILALLVSVALLLALRGDG